MTADQLAQLLDELSNRLSGPAAALFNITVQHVIVSAVVTIIISLALIVAAVIATTVAYRHYKGIDDAYSHARDDAGLVAFLTAVLSAAVGVVAVVFLTSAVIDLLTPQYTALTDILQHLPVPGK